MMTMIKARSTTATTMTSDNATSKKLTSNTRCLADYSHNSTAQRKAVRLHDGTASWQRSGSNKRHGAVTVAMRQ